MRALCFYTNGKFTRFPSTTLQLLTLSYPVRNAYPPYGFYILNRAGMEDHIQRLYPEDDITSADSYLIIRSYPEYTNQRMTEIHSSCSASSPPVNKFSEIYSRPGNLNLKTKEASNIIGLWYFANAENREPMIDVMKRCVMRATPCCTPPHPYFSILTKLGCL